MSSKEKPRRGKVTFADEKKRWKREKRMKNRVKVKPEKFKGKGNVLGKRSNWDKLRKRYKELLSSPKFQEFLGNDKLKIDKRLLNKVKSQIKSIQYNPKTNKRNIDRILRQIKKKSLDTKNRLTGITPREEIKNILKRGVNTDVIPVGMIKFLMDSDKDMLDIFIEYGFDVYRKRNFLFEDRSFIEILAHFRKEVQLIHLRNQGLNINDALPVIDKRIEKIKGNMRRIRPRLFSVATGARARSDMKFYKKSLAQWEELHDNITHGGAWMIQNGDQVKIVAEGTKRMKGDKFLGVGKVEEDEKGSYSFKLAFRISQTALDIIAALGYGVYILGSEVIIPLGVWVYESGVGKFIVKASVASLLAIGAAVLTIATVTAAILKDIISYAFEGGGGSESNVGAVLRMRDAPQVALLEDAGYTLAEIREMLPTGLFAGEVFRDGNFLQPLDEDFKKLKF